MFFVLVNSRKFVKFARLHLPALLTLQALQAGRLQPQAMRAGGQ